MAKKKTEAAADPNTLYLTEQFAPPPDPGTLKKSDVAPDVAAMDLCASTYGVKLPKAPASKVRRLREGILAYCLEHGKTKDDLLKCDVCGEIATADVDRCPFCGDAGGEEDAEPEAEASGRPDVSEEPEVDDEGEPEPPPPDLIAEDDAEEGVEGEVLTEEETALVRSRADLDERIARIDELKKDIAGKGWDLGREIHAIYENELWKARGRSSFRQFVAEDLDIGRDLAYGLMEASRQFKREDFAAVGQSKLIMIAKLPPGPERDALLEGAKDGDVTYRDLRGAAKETNANQERGGAGGGKRQRKGGTAPDPEPSSGPPEVEETFTVVGRFDAEVSVTPWRNATSGRKMKANKRVGMVEGAESEPEAFFEVALGGGVVLRGALEFDELGFCVGVATQFRKA